MISCNNAYKRVAAIACITFLVLVFWNQVQNNFGKNAGYTRVKLWTSVSYNCDPSKWNKDFPCKSVKLSQNISLPICTYKEGEDDTVSASFLQGSYWERDKVEGIIGQLKRHPGAEFIDIGANIGTYTLGVAHALKRRAVAIEPNTLTYNRLEQSICMGRINNLVNLHRLAISSSRGKVRLALNAKNRGVSVILNDTRCVLTRDKISCIDDIVDTIIMDDLVDAMTSKSAIIKVDAEGKEMDIFKDSTASHFFATIDVPVILMEFQYYTMFYGNKAPQERAKVDEMLKFFYSRNYVVKSADFLTSIDKDWIKWPIDIAFIKIKQKNS